MCFHGTQFANQVKMQTNGRMQWDFHIFIENVGGGKTSGLLFKSHSDA